MCLTSFKKDPDLDYFDAIYTSFQILTRRSIKTRNFGIFTKMIKTRVENEPERFQFMVQLRKISVFGEPWGCVSFITDWKAFKIQTFHHIASICFSLTDLIQWRRQFDEKSYQSIYEYCFHIFGVFVHFLGEKWINE